jgi:hypothetical protein
LTPVSLSYINRQSRLRLLELKQEEANPLTALLVIGSLLAGAAIGAAVIYVVLAISFVSAFHR